MNETANGKNRILIAIAVIIAVAALIGTVTYAWLAGNNRVDCTLVKGSVLKQYFHCGDGSEDDPFVITRPAHFYNLVYLYQRLEGFADEGYHFQLGYDLDGDSSTLEFFNYDEYGMMQEGYTDTLNMAYYQDGLLPIGTSDVPFDGIFDGKGLSIKNLKVISEDEYGGTSDVGIFGYVNETAEVRDVYFKNVTIDLTNSDPAKTTTVAANHNAILHDLNGDEAPDTVYVGYIAGHICLGAQVTNVYINDSKIVGGHSARSDYGYFGCVEEPGEGKVSSLGSLVATLRTKGSDAGFGGSIDMNKIFNRLYQISNTAYNAGTGRYVSAETVIVDGDTTTTVTTATATAQARFDNTRYFYYYSTPAGGSFNISSSNRATHIDGTDNIYECLYGASTRFPKVVSTYTIGSNITTSGFYIKSGNYYLVVNNGAIARSTTASTLWQMDASGHVYTQTPETLPAPDGRRILLDEKTYLNRANDNTLSLSTTGSTTWTKTTDQLSCTVSGTKRCLFLKGDQWALTRGPVITDGEGNYLRVTGTGNTSFTNTTDISQATEWTFSTSGTNPSGYISAVYNGTTVYLRNRNNTLQLTTNTNNRTSWSNDGNNIYNNQRYLTYDNGWQLSQTISVTAQKYKISSGTNYMAYTMNNGEPILTNATNANAENVILWNENSGNISTTINGTTYYLTSTTTDGALLTLSKTTNTATWNTYNTNYRYFTARVWFNNYRFWIVYNNGWKNVRTDNNNNQYTNASQLTFPNTSVTTTYYSKVQTFSDEYVSFENHSETYTTATKTVTTERSGNDTYFPIRVDTDAGGNFPSDFAASEKNTGYIVSGGNIEQATSSGSNDEFQKSAGDIRVAGWPISNISGSYSTSNRTFTTIYTVDAGGNHALTDAQKTPVFEEASKQLLETLNGASRVFGLHFMDALITTDHIVTAPQATILGTTYENYQLPEDSIDFNVIERGTISFFAGEYFDNNNAFFSLHQIFRDENNDITDIKEISEVYKHKTKDRTNYIYKYTDNTYTNADGTYTGATRLDDDYNSTPVFRTSWIKDPSGLSTANKRLYFFEIPCNAGEYALGSVSGKTGAYLVYLDIAANGGDAIAAVVDENENNPAKEFMVEFRDNPDQVGEGCVTRTTNGKSQPINNTVLLYSLKVPENATSSNFSIDITFSDDDSDIDTDAYPYGLYTIKLKNTTGNDAELFVLLVENDGDMMTPFGFAYELEYTNSSGTQTFKHFDLDYWKSAAGFIIPSTGDAHEMTADQYSDYTS